MGKCALVFNPDDPSSRSRTKQSFAKEADINNIMMRASKTGLLVDPSVVSNRRPNFGDFSDVGDFQSIVNRIRSVEGAFMMLSAKIRSKFDNDAGKLLDFVADPVNAKEAQELGLLPVPVVPVPVNEPAEKQAGQVIDAPVPPAV